MDHYIKDDLVVKYYVRYMDDFIIFCRDKDEAKIIMNKVIDFVNINLNLSLNHKSRYFPNYHGIDFCGYRIFETHIILRKRFKRKMKKSFKLWNKLIRKNKFYKDKFLLSYNSYKGHASHCDSFNYISKYNDLVDELLDNINF